MNQEVNADDYIGRGIDALPTPALVVEDVPLDENLELLARYFGDRECRLRPHFKSHKCVTLAKRQIEAGCTNGITCAKLSEAEQLVAGGVDDVLIANQIVGADKARRLAQLNMSATVRVAVDSMKHLAELGAAAREADVTIGVLVEVDIGMKRCGVEPGQAAVDLAYRAAETDGLHFDGLQAYEGHLVTKFTFDERKEKVIEAMKPLQETMQALASCGLRPFIVSSGGTGTYDITGNIEGIKEIQAGSYALMDASYTKVRPEFKVARYVLASIVSATGNRAVADVGVKGLGMEFGLPEVDGKPDAKVLYCAEEHTVIENIAANVGDRIRLIPSHGCTTNNLYRRMWYTTDGTIEEMWPIEAANCLE